MRPLWLISLLCIAAALVFLFLVRGGDRTAMVLVIIGSALNLIDQRLRTRPAAQPNEQS